MSEPVAASIGTIGLSLLVGGVILARHWAPEVFVSCAGMVILTAAALRDMWAGPRPTTS